MTAGKTKSLLPIVHVSGTGGSISAIGESRHLEIPRDREAAFAVLCGRGLADGLPLMFSPHDEATRPSERSKYDTH